MGTKKPADKINGNFVNKDVISLDQFDTQSIEKLFKRTQEIISLTKKRKEIKFLAGKIIALLFFEPSSRTFSSFASGIKRMGGQTIEYQNPLQTSSSVKGETLEDTVKVFESYADMIIMRHPQVGAPRKAAEAVLTIPVVNAGDGSGEHPTQTLYDLFTVNQKFNSLNNLKGVIAGDLFYGRAARSLIRGLSLYKNNTLYLLSPSSLRLEKNFKKDMEKRGLTLIEIDNEKDIPKDCNFWYWTRVQKERFADTKEYEKVNNKFILTKKLLENKGNKKLIILHPLPRVGEIETAVDEDSRAVYLTDQVKNGLYVRMALLSLVLGK